mgnify:CR=1 FL=1
MSNQTMYEQNVYFPDVFKGCKHNCVYCKPSFQRQAKRQKQRCGKCYTFEPHLHVERLTRKAPATHGNQFVFFPKGGDLRFATYWEVKKLLAYIRANSRTTFMSQSKDPSFWRSHVPLPANLIIGVTLETHQRYFDTRGGAYPEYFNISDAPVPMQRFGSFRSIEHNRKGITIEPILQFKLPTMVSWITSLKPEFVYIGYDTKKCNLPEPTLAETLALIDALEKAGLDVRKKTIRTAWYETALNLTQDARGKQ